MSCKWVDRPPAHFLFFRRQSLMPRKTTRLGKCLLQLLFKPRTNPKGVLMRRKQGLNLQVRNDLKLEFKEAIKFMKWSGLCLPDHPDSEQAIQ